MADFTEVLRKVAEEVGQLATGKLAKFRTELVEDATEFARRKQADLERWAGLVAEGKLSIEDAELLALGARNLVEMRAQTYIGIARIRLDQLRGEIASIVMKTAIALL